MPRARPLACLARPTALSMSPFPPSSDAESVASNDAHSVRGSHVRRSGQGGHEMSRNIALYDLGQCKQACHLEPIKRAKAPLSIRYTCDSHGQGVHEEQPVANELVSWVGAGRDQHSSQHFASAGCQPLGWGDSYGSINCSE
jgi:hypothetical protein